MTTQRTRDTAKATLDCLEENGWCQEGDGFSGFDFTGASCVVVAARNATNTESKVFGLSREIMQRLNLPMSVGNPRDAVIRWNDAPERTWDDVRSVLRDIIEDSS